MTRVISILIQRSRDCMSRPGIEYGPPAWEASTLEKSHIDSLFAGFGTTTWAEAGAARGLYSCYL